MGTVDPPGATRAGRFSGFQLSRNGCYYSEFITLATGFIQHENQE